MLNGIIRQFLYQVNWGDLDYLIVDMPPGTGDAQLTMAQAVPMAGAVIVTTPQTVALLDSRRGLKMFQQLGVPVLGIVENMSYFIPLICPISSTTFLDLLVERNRSGTPGSVVRLYPSGNFPASGAIAACRSS